MDPAPSALMAGSFDRLLCGSQAPNFGFLSLSWFGFAPFIFFRRATGLAPAFTSALLVFKLFISGHYSFALGRCSGSRKTSCYSWHSPWEPHLLDYPFYRKLWTTVSESLSQGTNPLSACRRALPKLSCLPWLLSYRLKLISLLMLQIDLHSCAALLIHSASSPPASWPPPRSLLLPLPSSCDCRRPAHKTP